MSVECEKSVTTGSLVRRPIVGNCECENCFESVKIWANDCIYSTENKKY